MIRTERGATPGEVIYGVAGLTLFGLMWGIWFEHPSAADIRASAIGFETSPDAWHAFAVIDVVLLFCVLCAVGGALLAAIGSRIRLPLDVDAVVAITGLVAVSLIAYRITEPISNNGIGYRRDLPIFLAFGAAVLIVLGGLMALREKHTSLASELKRASGGGDTHRPRARGTRGTASPPTPGRRSTTSV